MFSFIEGIGHYLPKKIVSNNDLSKILDTSDEWIFTRTGIKNRHIASDLETTSFMGMQAALEAINDAKLNINQIDGIIVATTTPELYFPSTAALVQEKLGATGFAFDVQAVCSGFIYGLAMADSLIKNNLANKILLIGSEKMSSIMNWQDRSTSVLFGDGAGAFIVSKSDALIDSNNNRSYITDSIIACDSNFTNILKTSAGVGNNSSMPDSNQILMQGTEVFKLGIEKMVDACKKILLRNNLTINDVSYIIPHQANIRILNKVAQYLGVSQEKIFFAIENCANTSAASIPIAACLNKHKLARGQKLLLTSAGAGFTWGAILLNW